jgi:cytochrome c oxidase subunit 2
MILQDRVWWLTVAGLGGVTTVFLYVISQATRQADASWVQAQSYVIRRWFFLALVAAGLVAILATLLPFPIPDQHAASGAAQIVKVTGHQWAWEVSPGPIKAGIPVEFDVTSADVNHGFAIYDAAGRLLAQTQAMPGVTNRLVHTFTKPGKYRVMCLEYCGLAHHAMIVDLDVIGPMERQP